MMDYLFLAITCNDPAPNGIANGQRQGNSPYTCNSPVTFVCNPGYQLQGSSRIVCQSNGQWSGGVPQCIVRGELKKDHQYKCIIAKQNNNFQSMIMWKIK